MPKEQVAERGATEREQSRNEAGFADHLRTTGREGFVYFIRAGFSGPIKIGWAKDPQRRLLMMQVGNHEVLRIIGLVACSKADELRWHARFRHLAIRGEWFRPSSDLVQAIRDAGNFKAPKRRYNRRIHSGPEFGEADLRDAMAVVDRLARSRHSGGIA